MCQIIAKLNNKDITKIPKDLFIAPDALKVFLEMFEGPLDLLLYLIKKQDIDILDISISEITDQYIEYINAMTILDLDLASDYLLMSSTLLTIKSKFMIPNKPPDATSNDDKDPIVLRQILINQLLEYEKIKLIAIKINQLPQINRDFMWVNIPQNHNHNTKQPISLDQLSVIWQKIINQQNISINLSPKEAYCINDIMGDIINILNRQKQTKIIDLCL